MKFFNTLLIVICSFLFISCSNNNKDEEQEDIFDVEWNKDIILEPNTMLFINSKGEEDLVEISEMRVLLQSDNSHIIEITAGNDIIRLFWYDKELEIVPGILETLPLGIFVENNKSINYTKGMVNILEVFKGEWDNDLNNRFEGEREIQLKAVFHIKMDIIERSGNKSKIIDNPEIKGVFYFSGIEKAISVVCC